MKSSVLIGALIIIIFGSCVFGSELPKGISTCSRSDENFNKCLSGAIQEALVFLRDGYAEFGLESIEPFRIAVTESESLGGTTNFYLKSSLKNAEIHGLTKGKVLRTATKFNKSYGIKLDTEFDTLTILGNYTMNGKILVLPINGEGKCNITLKEVNVRVESHGKYITKNNETYLDIQDFKIKLTPKRVYYNFENLFKNDKKLSDTINTVMNQEWDLVSKNLLPGYEEKFGQQFAIAANKIYQNVPFNVIYRE